MWKAVVAVMFIVLGAIAFVAVIGWGIFALLVWLGAPKWAAAAVAIMFIGIGWISNRK